MNKENLQCFLFFAPLAAMILAAAYILLFLPIMFFVNNAVYGSEFKAAAETWPVKGISCSYSETTLSFISLDEFIVSDKTGTTGQGKYEKNKKIVTLSYDNGRKETLEKSGLGNNILIRVAKREKTCSSVGAVRTCSDTTEEYFECNI